MAGLADFLVQLALVMQCRMVPESAGISVAYLL
jgi:hypothetical protein